jgi:hypothetical protein
MHTFNAAKLSSSTNVRNERGKKDNINVDVENFLNVLFNHSLHYKCYSVFLERDEMSFRAFYK